MSTIKWRSVIALSTAAVLSGGLLAGCSSSSSPSTGSSGGSNPLVQAKPSGTVVIGSNSFAESTLLADIYGQALAAKGFTVKYQLNIGARAVTYQQISSGALTVMPEYNGALLDYLDTSVVKKAAEAQTSTAGVESELAADLPGSLEVLTPAAAQDNDTLTLTQAEATKLHLSQGASIADFVTALGTQQITIGAAPEYQTKTDGLLGIEQDYGLKASQVTFKPLDEGGTLTEAALTNNSVEAGDLFTTDTTIAKGSMLTLTDPKNIFGLQNVVPLVYKSGLSQAGIDQLNAVSAKLDSATLLKLDNENAGQGQDPATVAKSWLTSEGLV
jgi:osmoprotectant transport system substrate-binding protein